MNVTEPNRGTCLRGSCWLILTRSALLLVIILVTSCSTLWLTSFQRVDFHVAWRNTSFEWVLAGDCAARGSGHRAESCDDTCVSGCVTSALSTLNSEIRVGAAIMLGSGLPCQRYHAFHEVFLQEWEGPWVSAEGEPSTCFYTTSPLWTPTCSARPTCGHRRICPCSGHQTSRDRPHVDQDAPAEASLVKATTTARGSRITNAFDQNKSDSHVSWEISDDGFGGGHSCDQTCKTYGMVCDEATISATTSEQKMKAAVSAVGETCTSFEPHTDLDGWDGPWFVNGLCAYSKRKRFRARCAIQPSPGFFRICACAGVRTVNRSFEKCSSDGPEMRGADLIKKSSNSIESSRTRRCLHNVSISRVFEHFGPQTQACAKGPFKNRRSHAPRRLALVIRGMCFRGGSGMSDLSLDCTQEAYDSQKEASLSQTRNVVEAFEDCGFGVDIFISTYKAIEAGKRGERKELKTGCNQNLMDWYGGQRRVRAARLEKSMCISLGSNQNSNYERGWKLVAKHQRKFNIPYDAIFFFRCDVIFKQPVTGLPGVDWQKFLVSFHEWERDNDQETRFPDMLQWFPYRFANCGLTAGFMEHGFWGMTEYIGTRNFGLFMPHEYHDSNTQIDRNPLYKLVRPENAFDINGGLAVLVAGVRPIREAAALRDSAQRIKQIAFVGSPPLVDGDLFVHSWSLSQKKEALSAYWWANEVEGRLAVGNLKRFLSTSCKTKEGQPLHAEQVLKNESSMSDAWRAWLQSVALTVTVVRQTEGLRKRATPYDVLAIVRDDYRPDHPMLWETAWPKLRKNAFVAFDKCLPFPIPSFILLSSVNARPFAKLPNHARCHDLPLSRASVHSWLERWLGVHVTKMKERATCKKKAHTEMD